MGILASRKRKKREAAEAAYATAVAEFELSQYGRLPTMEGDWIKKILGADKQITIDRIEWKRQPDTIAGTSGWHGRVVKQGGRPSRREDLWYEHPLIKIFYEKGTFSIRVDQAKVKDLRDTTKMYVGDPKLVYEKMKNKVTDKYAERRYLRDAALFV